MSDTELNGFSIEVRLDATVQAGESNWMKPGLSTRVSWTSIPTEQEVRTAIRFQQEQVLAPVLEEMVETIRQQLP